MKYFHMIVIVFMSAFIFISWNHTNTQTVLPPSRMEVYMQLASNDSTVVFNDTSFTSQNILQGTVFIKLQDTLSLAKIHVKLGTTQGGSDLFSKDFLYDDSGNFTDGTSYSRNGLNILLGIGQFTGLNSYYAEVKLEDTSQNLSDPVYYNQN